MRKYIFLQKLDEKGKSHKIEFRKLFDMFLDVLLFIFDTLIMNELLICFEQDDGFFQVTEEPFDETGDEVWIFNLLQVLIISSAEFIQGLIFFIY